MAKAVAWARAGVLTRTEKSPWEYFFHTRLLYPSAILITYVCGGAKFDHDTEGEKRKRETEPHGFTMVEATEMMRDPDLILSTLLA